MNSTDNPPTPRDGEGTDWRPAQVTVVGAGVMGRGIAYAAALGGSRTVLVDLDRSVLDTAVDQIGRDLQTGVERGKITSDDAEQMQERISTTTDLAEGCAGTNLVVEAVLERMDVKHEVMRTADRVAAADAVLATNTSGMSVTEIIACLDDPSRGVGMHFFNPVPKMRLCELIRGLQTSPDTLDRAESAARVMGKETVRVEDLPGFSTSRISALIANESMRMLEDGVASAEDIDKAVRLGLNHPMGPLEMGDMVGWDTRIDILEYLADHLGDRYRPTNLHRRLVAAGRSGRKSGHGVYRYDADGNRMPAESP